MKDAIKEARADKTVTHKRANQLIVKYRDRTTPAPQPLEVNRLKSSVRQFSESIDSVIAQLTAAQTRTLADQLLDLALKLRQAVPAETEAQQQATNQPPSGDAKPPAKRSTSRRKPAASKPRKRETAAA